MIQAYVVGISTHQEGEEIEIRYSIFQDGKNLTQEKKYQEYKKPFLVTHFAILAFLKDLKKYPKDETEIIMYDSAVMEQLNGTSTTNNKEALSMAKKVINEIEKLDHTIKISDVTGNSKEKLAWNKVLEY